MTIANMNSSQVQTESGLPATDEALVRAAQAGDVQAFSALVETHQRLARAIAFSVTSDYNITEDLAQEALVTAWLRISDLGDPSKFRPWLASIVRNTARYWRRHQGRHAPRAQFGLEVLELLPDGEDSPLEHALEKEGRAHARDAFEGLPSRYKEPLLLYYCLDESHEQVASALGVSEAAVRQRLCRARKKLKQDVSGLERTGKKLRNSVSAAASVLLMIQTKQSFAAAAAPASKASLLASPKLFVGLGALAGGALVACVGAIVLYLGASDTSVSNPKAPAIESRADKLPTGASATTPPESESRVAGTGQAALDPAAEDSRGLVLMGTGRVKEKSEGADAPITGRNRTALTSALASGSKVSENQDESKPRGGRVHKHGPARLHPADTPDAARPMLKPTLNLNEVQRELWEK